MASSTIRLRHSSLGMLSLASGTSSGPSPYCSDCWVPNLREVKEIAFSLRAMTCGTLAQSRTMEKEGSLWKILLSLSRQEPRLVDVRFLNLNPERIFMAVCFSI